MNVVEIQGWDWNFVHGKAHRAENSGVAEKFYMQGLEDCLPKMHFQERLVPSLRCLLSFKIVTLGEPNFHVVQLALIRYAKIHIKD